MPNIAVVLKEEIRRLAKKEVKANTSSTKGVVAQFRRDIAKLKRLVRVQEREITFLKTQEQERIGQSQTNGDEEMEGVRHSARSVQAQRKRLKLSAADFGKLVGVSGLTVYSWEHGRRRPRKEKLAALVVVRQMGRREALAKLDAIKGEKRAVRKTRRKPR
jgi:DNA-binding transcriptional regulator YiaG